MNIRRLSTEVNINKSDLLFNSKSNIVGIGSCFAQYVMEQFQLLGMNVSYNPNGIVYNSYSICKSLRYLDDSYNDSTFFKFNEFWHSWEHHGCFSSNEREKLIKDVNESKQKFLTDFKKANLFILTQSSSVVYRYLQTNNIVSNCHKVPNDNFKQDILSKEENYKYIKESIDEIRKINPNCVIVITLSPVRHYPGNLVLNARSKANLLSAIHEVIKDVNGVIYFPSYEIVLDELRDYRFYDNDMLHPSQLAREIIFERFIENFFDPDSLEFFKKQKQKLKQSSHRQLQK